MIDVAVVIQQGRAVTHLQGAVVNISSCRAVSSYRADFEGRNPVCLKDYPRWSESVRAMIARCLSTGGPSGDAAWSPDPWSTVQINIEIRNGSDNLRPISVGSHVERQSISRCRLDRGQPFGILQINFQRE
jgi:hypothetical protein